MSRITELSTTDRVHRAVADAAARTGVPFDFLLNQARVESNLDPQAKARTSSASGLFQFTRSTWRQMIQQHGNAHGLGWASAALDQGASSETLASIDALRFDPELSSLLAGEFAADNRAHLEGRLGRGVQQVDLYLAHFLGPAGAERFLRAMDADPEQAAATLLPEAAQSNRPIFYKADGTARSLREVRELFVAKLSAGAAAAPPTTVAARQSRVDEPAPRRPLELAALEPMPGRLSLDFAARAYARVAGGAF